MTGQDVAIVEAEAREVTAEVIIPPVGVPEQDGLWTDIPDTVYHADRGSLSSSGARKLLRPYVPAIFDYERANPPDPKAQYDFGHAAHKFVLGVGEEIVEIDAGDWKTKRAQEARREAWDAGKIPLLSKDVAKARAMADKALQHPRVAEVLSVGSAEVSGYWHDDVTGVRLRLRMDWLHPGVHQLIVGEYKTTTSADPVKFSRACADYGYHIAAGWYLAGLEALGVSEATGYDLPPGFLFMFQSKEPPYLVSVGELDPIDIERGKRLARRAVEIYAECQSTGQWPDYGDHVHRLSIPSYQRYQEEEYFAS